jgi:hypothetical protein
MRAKIIYVFLSFFLITGFYLLPAQGEEPGKEQPIVPPSSRLYLSSLTIARYNPLGIETQNRLMYSMRLFDSSSLLFRDTFFAIGPSLKLNPAYLKVGPLIDFQPITILNIRIAYEFIQYFGSFGYLQSYNVSNAPYSDDTRDETKQSAYSTNGHHYYIEPTLQMKVGDFAARTKFAFEYWVMNLHQGDRFFYDATLDTLVPIKKLVWTNDTDFLYMNGPLTMGIRYSAVIPGTDEYHMRVGPIVAWSFNTNDYTSFNKPTILMILGWYVRHPNRQGGVPYILLGFSFSTDFL